VGGGVSRFHYNCGYHGPGFSGGLPLVVCSAHFRLRDFKLSPRSRLELRSFGLLRIEDP